MIIVPAILTDDKESLIRMIRTCESFTDYIHIDIMDGDFVPSRSITTKDLLDVITTLRIEVHLMAYSPEDYIEDLKRAGVFKIIFHFEATRLKGLVLNKLKESGLEMGLAINPETKLIETEYLLDKIDSILLMSVNPGFYGARFIPEVLDKAKALKLIRPNSKIAMDGGIKIDNLLKVKEALIDIACIGSAILKADDPKAAFLTLSKINEDP